MYYTKLRPHKPVILMPSTKNLNDSMVVGVTKSCTGSNYFQILTYFYKYYIMKK